MKLIFSTILVTSVVSFAALTTASSPLIYAQDHTKHQTTTTDNGLHPKQVSVNHVVLADSNIPGMPNRRLELIDVKGKFAKSTDIGPFQGDNWTGQFQLRVVNPSGQVLSILNLPDSQANPMLFMSKFQFHFADYNGDGYPDFTLGQYASSNGYDYELYTIKPSGLLRLSTGPTDPIFVSDSTYSPLFNKVRSNGFQIKYYDNSKATWFQATYIWKNSKFNLVLLNSASGE